jgi:hypothetical protein
MKFVFSPQILALVYSIREKKRGEEPRRGVFWKYVILRDSLKIQNYARIPLGFLKWDKNMLLK